MFTREPILERWLRGRKRRFAKPLYGLIPVSRVRIPPSPYFFFLKPVYSLLFGRSDTSALPRVCLQYSSLRSRLE